MSAKDIEISEIDKNFSYLIFDTDTKTVEAIPNPLTLFEKIY